MGCFAIETGQTAVGKGCVCRSDLGDVMNSLAAFNGVHMDTVGTVKLCCIDFQWHRISIATPRDNVQLINNAVSCIYQRSDEK